MAILDIRDRPALRRPVMIAGFGGWGDAGSGATGAIGYLLGESDLEPCATLDPEESYSFTDQRPVTSRTSDGKWTLTYPRIRLFAIQRPQHERDLVLMTGPEPNLKWPSLTAATAAYAKELGVETLITLGVFLGPISHRQKSLVRRTLDPALDERLAELNCVDTGYEGPTGFVTALLHAFKETGIPAASIWSAAPMYLRAVNPAVARLLLETVERATGLDLDLGLLRDRARLFLREVDKMLAENPKLVKELSELVDLEGEDDEQDRSPSDSQDLPPASTLVEELEQFLREKRGDGEQ